MDSERTELIVVGIVDPEEDESGEGYCVICLPFLEEKHRRSWTAFRVTTLQGSRRLVRFSRVPLQQRQGLITQETAGRLGTTRHEQVHRGRPVQGERLGRGLRGDRREQPLCDHRGALGPRSHGCREGAARRTAQHRNGNQSLPDCGRGTASRAAADAAERGPPKPVGCFGHSSRVFLGRQGRGFAGLGEDAGQTGGPSRPRRRARPRSSTRPCRRSES